MSGNLYVLRRTSIIVSALVAIVIIACIWWQRIEHDPSQVVVGSIPRPNDSSVAPARTQAAAVERTPVPSQSDARNAIINFCDERGVAIPGCSMSTVRDGLESALGNADDVGVLSVAASLVEDREIIARHAQHQSSVVQMPSTVESATIVLHRLSTISGLVLRSDGQPPSEPLTLVIYEDKRPPTCVELTSSSTTGHWKSAVSDQNGMFVVTGLNPARKYTIAGAGLGYVIEGPQEGISPGGHTVILTALPLYGMRVNLLDSSGHPLRANCTVFSASGGGIRCLDPNARAVNVANELSLVEKWDIGCIDSSDLSSMALVYSATEEKADLPVIVAINRPGYKERREVIRMPRLQDRLTAKDILLDSDNSPTGAVNIRLLNSGGPLSTKGSVGLIGDTPLSSFYLEFARISDDTLEFKDVPCGNYKCAIRICDGLVRTRADEAGLPLCVDISPNTTSELVLDLSRFNRIDVHLLDELGVAYTGPAMFMAIDSPRTVHFVSFERAPYVLIGLRPGVASISALRGRGAYMRAGDGEFSADVTTVDGQAQTIKLLSKYWRLDQIR